MNTFSKMWDVKTLVETHAIIEQQKAECVLAGEPTNLEKHALSLVGTDIFTKLVKEYTEKQWGYNCAELSASTIHCLTVSFTYNNNYLNDRFQGIPIGGYAAIVERILGGAEVLTGCDYHRFSTDYAYIFVRVVYFGSVDECFDFNLGQLEWCTTITFDIELIEGEANWQGNAVVNYTSHDVAFTWIIEHKHFEFGCDANENDLLDTVIGREYSITWEPGDESYYPVNDERNNHLLLSTLSLLRWSWVLCLSVVWVYMNTTIRHLVLRRRLI